MEAPQAHTTKSDDFLLARLFRGGVGINTNRTTMSPIFWTAGFLNDRKPPISPRLKTHKNGQNLATNDVLKRNSGQVSRWMGEPL